MANIKCKINQMSSEMRATQVVICYQHVLYSKKNMIIRKSVHKVLKMNRIYIYACGYWISVLDTYSSKYLY